MLGTVGTRFVEAHRTGTSLAAWLASRGRWIDEEMTGPCWSPRFLGTPGRSGEMPVMGPCRTYGGAMNIRNTLFAMMVLGALADSASATDGLEPIDASMQARARGGADVAIVDSVLSQLNNPAGLALRPRGVNSFDFSGQLLFTNLRWKGPADDSTSHGMFPLMNFGLAYPIDDRWTYGIAMHSKSGRESNYNRRHLLIPFMNRRVGSDIKNASLSFNLGSRVTDKLSVGVGVRAEMVAAKFSAVLGPADVDFGRGFAYGVGFNLGVHYQARDDLSFGFTYRSPSWFGDLSGGDLDVSLLGVLPIKLGRANIDEFRLPQQVSAGVAWDANDWLKLVGEVRWTDYPSSSFGSMTVAVNGPIDMRFPFPASYKEQWVFIAGAEIRLDSHWTLGVGYNYASNVVPDSNVLAIAPATLEHHITTGLRYEQDHWWVGGGYIYGFNTTTRADGSTDVPLGIDFASSEIDHQQHSVFFGFGFDF